MLGFERLAALDDAGDAEVAEDRGEAVARDDGDDAERERRRRGASPASAEPFRSGSAAVPVGAAPSPSSAR